jgi:hypothetical protein
MDRRDDPTISGDVVLYRRIPPWPDNVTWDQDGQPSFSSLNFKDKNQELSVHLASEATPDDVLRGHEAFGLVQITAQQVRDICGAAIVICRCTEEPAMGHVLVCGKMTGGTVKKLQRAARWVEGRWPARNPPPPSAGPLEE